MSDAASTPASPDPDAVREALRGVSDPEIGVNIVDLGLVYGIETGPRLARVRMTMTTPSCPLSALLTREVEAAVRRAFPALHQVEVELVWEPRWTAAMMSDAARAALSGRRAAGGTAGGSLLGRLAAALAGRRGRAA